MPNNVYDGKHLFPLCARPECAQAFVTTLLGKGVQHCASTPRGRCRFGNTTLPTCACALQLQLLAHLVVYAIDCVSLHMENGRHSVLPLLTIGLQHSAIAASRADLAILLQVFSSQGIVYSSSTSPVGALPSLRHFLALAGLMFSVHPRTELLPCILAARAANWVRRLTCSGAT